MTYNHHGSDKILNGKKLHHYRTLNNTTPTTFRTTYDHSQSDRNYNASGRRQIIIDNNNRSNIIDFRSPSRLDNQSPAILDSIEHESIVNRSKSYGFRKPLNSFSSSSSSSSSFNIATVANPRVQPNYLSTVRLSYQHLLNQIAQITDTVYLSSVSAVTLDRIRELGVTMLVSMITDPVPLRASNLENVLVPIEDTEYANLRSYLDRIVDKIHREQLRGGKILVHCVAGVSRSSSLVIAYLMKYHAMRLRQAYNHVRARRPYIQPNIGFWKQLIEYEKRLFGSPSVRLIANPVDNSVSPDVPPSALGRVLFNSTGQFSKARFGGNTPI